MSPDRADRFEAGAVVLAVDSVATALYRRGWSSDEVAALLRDAVDGPDDRVRATNKTAYVGVAAVVRACEQRGAVMRAGGAEA